MSVLACTIGALTLLLASLSLSAVTPREGPSATPAPHRGAEPSSDESSRPTDAERAAADALESLWRRVDAALANRGQAEGSTLDELESRLASAKQTQQLEADLVELTAAERALAAGRDRVEASIAVLESRRETLPILIDPTGLSRHLEPWFVECDARGVTAYRASDGYAHFVPRDELGPSDDYGRYLRRLRAIPGALLVLLVRPDGLATTEIAAGQAHAAGVRVARLPLPGRGELDWTLLRRAEESRPR